MKSLNIILVDDSLEFRQSMRELLEIEFSANIIAEASSGLEFFKLPNLHEADIVLMDLSMPDLGGLEVTQCFLYGNSKVKIIAVTMFTDQAYLDQLIFAGFKGCIFKDTFLDEVKEAIQAVAHGSVYFPNTIKLSE